MSTRKVNFLKFILLLTISLLEFVYIQPAKAIDLKKCLLLFRKNPSVPSIARSLVPPDPVLESFDPSKLGNAKISLISEMRIVLRVQGSAEKDYVLRMSGPAADPKFESFASNFILSVPGLNTSKVRVLTPKEGKKTIEWIKKRNRDIFSILHETLVEEKKDLADARFTVSRFHQNFKTGHEFIVEHDFQSPLAEYLATLGENPIYSGNLSESQINATAHTLEREWDNLELSGRERQSIFLDNLKQTSDIPKNLSIDSFVPFIIKELPRLGELKVANLYMQYLKKIPQNLLTQVADHWSITIALGIHDFHWKNWGVQGSNVVAIDLAYKSNEFEFGKAAYAGAQNPFGQYPLSKQTLQFLRKSISTPMQDFLRAISRDSIKAVARESQYNITEKQIDGIVLRVKNILED